ncbi:UvrD-helicase domain-containing protein [Rhodoferax antarcticus]|uniref:UvrD-helicase domain-containing protein n=1 Tax=Rhodoferax antarcticus TaxID=81479 RepID=UPI0022243868|nr:UvrD-helicase domain-containing protein [Rhodoferax antarcticus]
MAWLIPFSNLTPAQQDAVQMDTRNHKAIIGGPGAGKTLVLLHRLNLLYHRAGDKADAVHLFVYTNTLKEFIRAGNDMLDVPDECIGTFDKWCADVYRAHIAETLPRIEKPHDFERTARRGKKSSRTLPRTGGTLDFEAIRAGAYQAIAVNLLKTPVFEYVLVDEAQDLDVKAIDALKRIARHVTVCMDGNQQLYESGVSEIDALAGLGLARHNAALLSAFRCNPMVTQLAAQFVTDARRREEFLRQATNANMDRATPLLYLSSGFEDEKARLTEMVRLRLSYGDTIAVLFPTQRQVHGFANGFADAGIEVSVQKRDEPIDFASPVPKLMTYHQGKGLTFDSVFLPRLDQGSFQGAMQTRINNMLFVGISRAIKWIFMSGTNGRLIGPLTELAQRDNHAFLETQLADGAEGMFGGGAIDAAVPATPDDFGLD